MIKDKEPFHEGLDYESLSAEEREGLLLLERALGERDGKLANTCMEAWLSTLSTSERRWLSDTAEGRKEMWARYGMAISLCADLKR